MSNFYRQTKHPDIGKFQKAFWNDDHFGSHNYGVQFPDGQIFDPRKVDKEPIK